MIYARAHDQTVEQDYYAAMSRIEQRLALPEGERSEQNNRRRRAPAAAGDGRAVSPARFEPGKPPGAGYLHATGAE